MRGPGVTQGAKRSQGARGRVIEPRNALFVRADVVRWTEGYLAASQRPWRRRPRRGPRGMRAGGFPGNPGGLVVSILKTAGGRAWLTKPEAVDVAPGVRRSEPQVLGWYRRAKAKRGGMDGEESECLIVQAGELSPRDPVEGRGHRQVAPLPANTPRLGPVSTSRQRIAELARPWGWRWPSPGFLDQRVRDGA